MQTKIISLIPSATEIVCALGLEKNLIGRSHLCDFPLSVKKIPVCTSDTPPGDLNGIKFNDKVKENIYTALSVFRIDFDLIKQLAPDVVITRPPENIAAHLLNEAEHMFTNYLDKPVQVISIQPNSLSDIFDNINTIASILNVPNEGSNLIEELQTRVDIVRHKLKFVEKKPAVACIEQLAPIGLAGNYIAELVRIAGGTPVVTMPGQGPNNIYGNDVRSQGPDILVIMPRDVSIEHTLKEAPVLLQSAGFVELKAVKEKRVYIADGSQYFNHLGLRSVDSIEILAEIINPKQFFFGHEGQGWIRFDL